MGVYYMLKFKCIEWVDGSEEAGDEGEDYL